MLFIAIFLLNFIISHSYRILYYSTRFNPVVHSKANDDIYTRLSSLHDRVFEVKEFQLHIPPIANFKPKLNRHLTRPDVYKELTGDNLLNEDEGDYMDEPLDVIKMVKDGKIEEYRHNNHGMRLEPGESSLYTWNIERPADVYIMNWTGTIYFGLREYIVISSKILLDVSKLLTNDAKELLNEIIKEYKIPVWLNELFKYSYPYINDISDWIIALSIFLKDYKHIEDNKTVKELKQIRKNSSSLDELNRLTHNYDPFKLVDFLSTERYNRNIKSDLLYNWKIDNGLYNNELKLLKISNNKLKQVSFFIYKFNHLIYINQLFKSYRNKFRTINFEDWKDLILYRTNCKHLDDKQKIHHEAFNNGIIELITHHIKVFRMPIYLISDLETTDEIWHQLNVMNLHHDELIHVLGIEHGDILSLIKKLYNSLNIDKRIPIHYFDDRLISLENIINTKELNNIRTYFIDWGRSTWDEKLGALYNNYIKYIKTTSWLIEFLVKFSTMKGREWTHGYRIRYPDEEISDFKIDWKNKWHDPDHKDLPGARSLPVL